MAKRGTWHQLDSISKQFQHEIEAVVEKYADGDPAQRAARWKQLYSWGMSRSQGDVVKKAALRKALIAEKGGQCDRCGLMFEPDFLDVDRIDESEAMDASKNHGYRRENVQLLCRKCHNIVGQERSSPSA